MSGKASSQEEYDLQNDIPDIAVWSKLKELQDKVTAEQEKIDTGIEEIRRKYFKLMEPHFKTRSEMIHQVPGFWYQVLNGHPEIQSYVSDENTINALTHLRDISFTDIEDKDGFKISFEFEENEYFTDKFLEKEYTNVHSGEPACSHTTIHWKPNMNIVEILKSQNMEAEKEEDDDDDELSQSLHTIFEMFDDDNTDPALALIIRDEIYIDPVGVLSNFEEYDETEEEEEEEGEEGEEEEEEGGEYEEDGIDPHYGTKHGLSEDGAEEYEEENDS